MAESKKFIEKLSSDRNLKDYSKVSIITYTTSAKLNCENQNPNVNLLNSVKFMGGGTNFDKPLMLVKDLAIKHLNDFDSFHVCFLSDGIASLPKEAIN